MDKKTFLFGGYSQFPQGTPGHEIFKYFGIGFEVDPDSWEIIDVSSTFLTELSSSFLRSVFVGKNIRDGGVADGIREFEVRYFCKGKKTIIAAIIEAEKSYLNYLTQ
ncbi:MAG: DUF3870 domain-containing protein [Cloacibacillus porcorum]|uniref:DUF3870 domain-containing protein n=1 Tax=Cloacibacillus porcorum TaxID=1197717 RepID=UPI0023525A89|nr:DUF3870 domain-containing protein [Cloacibacillus porcorum]MCI5863806.1 DUF3870 domain-containing protein [Cloacibacillus porcorum]